jgi:peptide maturation system protein (TIGR04066 family)
MMKKLLIFPFTKDMCPLVRYRDTLDGYDLISAVPEKGFGWEGKDICELDGGKTTGFILGSSFETELKRCDTVLLNPDKTSLNKEERHKYEAFIKDAGKELLTLAKNAVSIFDADIFQNKLKDVPVPVIMVMGLGENCQKFDIQIGLRKAFQKEGYKVAQYGTKKYSGLFGFDALPELPELTLEKKVYIYNHLFSEKYNIERPDVMIIGVPGGIMPYDACDYGRFGEDALALSYAGSPDAAVLSYYFTFPTKEYFELYRQLARFRFGIDNLFFHASNTNADEDKRHGKLSFLTLDSKVALNALAEHDIELPPQIFNIFISESCERIYQSIIEELRQNIDIL